MAKEIETDLRKLVVNAFLMSRAAMMNREMFDPKGRDLIRSVAIRSEI